MLRFLRVEHLAVIDALQVEFEPGLNVLTGETGAGKSMLVEAIGLLMGGRASADLIRTGESAAQVQAIFDTAGGELIVRRDITSQGRSRAFIDDALVTSAVLRDRTSPLVELHGQHEHQTLIDPQSHLLILDEFAGLSPARQQVAQAFGEWKRLQAERDAIEMDAREKAARLDLLSFQCGELDRARLRSGEDEELATARRILSSADKLRRLSAEAYALLYDSDAAALASLSGAWKRVGELAEVDPVFLPHLDARDVIKSQLEDLALTLRAYGERIDASPARLQEVEDRLALVERLKRKYGPSLDEAIARQESLARQIDALQNAGERRAELESATAAAREQFASRAGALSRKRREASKKFCGSVQKLLGELAMGGTRFDVAFEPATPDSAWNDTGVDAAEFYLSANIGEEPRPLARIASGGELSRVMLAIRTLAAAESPGKTLLFDEIDAGIGGRVADVVGKKLRSIGETFQVLCITHLPQIAAAGHVHYQISKTVSAGRTQTRVVKLDRAARVEELARMIGGAVPTAAARGAAKELLGESESEAKPKAKVVRSGGESA